MFWASTIWDGRRRLLGERKRKRAARKRDGRRCQACGSDKELTVHHIVPRHRSGPTHRKNLITLCRTCHDQWHRCERHYYDLSFEDWVQGGEVRKAAQERSKFLRFIVQGRWTGESYAGVAARLSEAGQYSPRGKKWTPGNLASWVRRNAPELGVRKSMQLIRWPIFALPLEEGIWRWYFFEQPLGVSHFRGERRVLDKYNFSRYHKTTGKFLSKLYPVSGMHVYRGSIQLEANSARPAEAHDGPYKQIVAFLCDGRLRRARRQRGGAYVFSGPIFSVPADLVGGNGWEWVDWETIEPILVQKARKRMRA